MSTHTRRLSTSASALSSNSSLGVSAAAASAGTTCQKHSSRPVAGTSRQPQMRTRRGASCEAVTERQTGRLSLQGAALAADGTACWRPKPWNRASFANIAHLRFRASRRSVSVRVSDPLGAIAYPNAATVAAIDLDVLRCRQPGPIHLVGATEGGTAHLLVLRVKIGICSRLSDFWSLSPLNYTSQALSSIPHRGWVLSSTVDRKSHGTPSSSQHHQAAQAR